MGSRAQVVRGRKEPAERGHEAQPGERIARDVLRNDLFVDAAGIVETDRLRPLIADSEQIETRTARRTQPLEERVTERLVLVLLSTGPGRLDRRISQEDEAMRIVDRQRPQNQRVDQRERRNARAHRQRQREHGAPTRQRSLCAACAARTARP